MSLLNYLITADLHLSDRKKDEYRFGIFSFLAQQQKLHKVSATFILGDLTEHKDKHSSALVNRIVDELTELIPPVFILKGNHDYIDADNPFFRFLNCIEGIEFISKPILLENGVCMIPHCKDQFEFNEACWGAIPPKARAVMLHQTFADSIAESGSRLTGLSAAPIEALKPLGAYAGDVHKPQVSGPVTYVGAPYTVRFGDNFTPRVLLIKGGKEHNLHFPAPRKWALSITSPDDLIKNKALRRGDQVKLTIKLAREEVVEWSAYRQQVLDVCKVLELEVFDTKLEIMTNKRRERLKPSTNVKTPQDIFTSFCSAENVASNVKKAGMEML